MLQDLEENDFAKEYVAPALGIKKSTFFETLSTRGENQLGQLFSLLVADATEILPSEYADLGNLTAIDGSHIDSVLSMEWADYRGGLKKAKTHIGFDINRGIQTKLFLTDGKQAERPFVDKIIKEGETGVCDRGYQSNNRFYKWQISKKQFVVRIKKSAVKTLIRENTLVGLLAMWLLGQ